MQVKVLRDCFVDKYYTEGTEDDYEGPPNHHLEPIDKSEKAKWAKALAPKPAPAAAPAAAANAAAASASTATDTKVDLTSMTKAEIVEHAAEVHGLDLDHSVTKDELIDQVKEAEKAAS